MPTSFERNFEWHTMNISDTQTDQTMFFIRLILQLLLERVVGGIRE